MAMTMAACVLFSLLLASPAAFAKDHIVGGDSGWTQSGDYATWASGEMFTVGDNLVFNYGGSHGVDEVSKDDYDNCNAGNFIKSYSDGQTTIKLSKAGAMYFMCPTAGHCQSGMKLAINVVSGSSSTPTPTPSGGATSPSTPSTPSGSDSPTTPSTPAEKSSPNAAAVGGSGMNILIVGFLGALFALMS